jgi:hypothetical protein
MTKPKGPGWARGSNHPPVPDGISEAGRSAAPRRLDLNHPPVPTDGIWDHVSSCTDSPTGGISEAGRSAAPRRLDLNDPPVPTGGIWGEFARVVWVGWT